MPPPPTPNFSCSFYFQDWIRKRTKSRDYYNNSDPIKRNSKLYLDELTETFTQRLREVYPNLASKSDKELHYYFSTFVTNPTAQFNQQFRPVRYYSYSVGNGITWSGVDFTELFGLSAEYFATDMVIMGSWHNVISNGRLVLKKIDLKEVYYSREFLGYDDVRRRAIWGEWQYTGEFEYNLKCANPNSSPLFLPPPLSQTHRQGNEIWMFVVERIGLF